MTLVITLLALFAFLFLAVAAFVLVVGTYGLVLILPISLLWGRKVRCKKKERAAFALMVKESQAKADALLREALILAGTDLGTLSELDPADFEIAVAQILEACGEGKFDRIGRAGDDGADLIRTDSTGRVTIVQCKRYSTSSQIGTPALRNFLGAMVHYRASQGIFVTTATYSVPAHKFAMEHGIRLIAGGTLARMARGVLDQS
ncbi:MAG: restriction endonuclease [Acidobacteriota bacterium]|nr:restriction endonuclease [Acidobacteriota bacterium]